MDGNDFVRFVREAFEPFLTKLGFSTKDPSISGRYYRARFDSERNSVWVSYEPGDEALFVYVFNLENGKLSDIDDVTKTPRLADLSRRYMQFVGESERHENKLFFESVKAKDPEERLLLKCSMDLRLVLPKYLADTNRRS